MSTVSRNGWYPDPATPALWTDYLGVQPYGDYQVTLDPNNVPIPSQTARYLTGLGIHGQQTMDGQTDPVAYLHADLIGSTFLTTDAAGQAEQRAVYTVFGEYVAPNGAIGGELPAGFPRYAYAGEHGYEHGLLALFGVNEALPPLTLLHVGERWYDPALGRFLQRDPIGLDGALNVYAYVEAEPLASVDALGLAPFGALQMGAVYRGWRETGKSVDEAVHWTSRWAIESGAIEATAALGCVPCGGGARGSLVAVTAERATGVAYRGGIKLTVTVVCNGKQFVRDVIIKAGKIVHEHWKGKPPWPPVPPIVQ